MTDNASTSNTWRTGTSGTIVGGGGSTSAAMAAAAGIVVPGESTSSMQKRGAERLFQYMEADGSDPEDYSR